MQILCKFYANEIYLCPELDKEWRGGNTQQLKNQTNENPHRKPNRRGEGGGVVVVVVVVVAAVERERERERERKRLREQPDDFKYAKINYL